METQTQSLAKGSTQDHHFIQSELLFEQNLLRLQESINRRKKWRMNDFIRKKILRETIENKLLFYRESQQHKNDAANKSNFFFENQTKSTVNLKRELPLRSVENDFQNSLAIRSMPEFNESMQQRMTNRKHLKQLQNEQQSSLSPTNAINISPDLPDEMSNELIVSGVNFKDAKLKKSKEKIKALKKYFSTKPKADNDTLPIIREQTELQITSKISPELFIENKNKPQQQKILPKICNPSKNNDNIYKSYCSSSLQLFSGSGSGTATLPVINLNKLTIMNPNKSCDQIGFGQTTNYSKFIHNLKHKNFDKNFEIYANNDVEGGPGQGGGGGCSVIDLINNEVNKFDGSNETTRNTLTPNNKLNKLNINFSMRNNTRHNSYS